MLRILLVWTALALAACTQATAEKTAGEPAPAPKAQAAKTPAPEKSALELSSTAFAPGAAIPAEYTCQGENVSPPLAWKGIPAAAKSLVLVVDDPDAPDPKAPKMVWVHWLLYDIPPSAAGLPRAAASLPAGTRQGKSSWKKTGYGGPCPPIGQHRYFFKLYALDCTLGDLGEPDERALLDAVKGHVLAQAELIGTYEKTER